MDSNSLKKILKIKTGPNFKDINYNLVKIIFGMYLKKKKTQC